MTLYEKLGVAADADEAAIRKGFRDKSKECHPDRFPGDPAKEAEFKELTAAEAILMDPEKRRIYDLTGSAEEASRGKSAVEAFLASTFVRVILEGADGVDALGVVKIVIQNDLSRHRKEAMARTAKIEKLRAAAGRVKFSGEGPNVILAAIEEAISGLGIAQTRTQAAIDFMVAADNAAGFYEYSASPGQPYVTMGWTTSFIA